MAKQGGMGDNFYVGAFDLSGDVGSLSKIGGGPASLAVTGINKSGMERLGGLRTGEIAFTTFLNDAAGQAHPTLSALPTTDKVCSYFHGPQAVGASAASQTSQLIDYNGTRGTDGSLTFNTSAQSNGFGIEWGRSLTAGRRVDTVATNGTAIDTLASASFGAQAYLHVFAFTGTSVIVKIQDSADNISFADVASLTFGTISAVGDSRIAISNTATVRRYVRVITGTGTFSSIDFAVNCIKNENAGVVF
jgi:hypothetical protein